MANSTAQSENLNENESDGLEEPYLKILNCAHAQTRNARKRPQTMLEQLNLSMLESTFHEDWDEVESNRAKKGHLLLKSAIYLKLVGCQWVKVITS